MVSYGSALLGDHGDNRKYHKGGEAAQMAGTFGTHFRGMKGADHLPTSHENVVADIKVDGGRVHYSRNFSQKSWTWTI